MRKCPAVVAPGTSIRHHRRAQGDGEVFFLSVSPFAVTAAPAVGEVFFMFFPSVEWPVESVTPDCV